MLKQNFVRITVRAAPVPDQQIAAPRRDAADPLLERLQVDMVQVPAPVLPDPPGPLQLRLQPRALRLRKRHALRVERVRPGGVGVAAGP